MWDTIEHLQNPAAYLPTISCALRPGGILALTTGDVGSLVARVRGRRWRLYYAPFHLHYFSRATVRQLLGRFGFEVVEIRAVGFSRSLETMSYRMFVERKPRPFHAVYRAASWARLTRPSLYLNIFDIMLVVARKSEKPA